MKSRNPITVGLGQQPELTELSLVKFVIGAVCIGLKCRPMQKVPFICSLCKARSKARHSP